MEISCLPVLKFEVKKIKKSGQKLNIAYHLKLSEQNCSDNCVAKCMQIL